MKPEGKASWQRGRYLTAIAGVLCSVGCLESPSSGGDLTANLTCSIPESQIFDGGPGRDGIPALDFPDFVQADEAGFLDDGDRVLGIEINGDARAYPLFVLWLHEIVNDRLGGEPVLVSYCPLTGSGLAFDPVVRGVERNFGVSGLLFENNLIMFDRQSESLWNQLLLGAQCGPERGTELARRPLIETTWQQWRSLHPETTVLSRNTGFPFSYGSYPYGNYDDPGNPSTLFPSSPWDPSRPPKELVLGIHEGNEAVAYPFGALAERGAAVAINDTVGARAVLVTFRGAARTAQAFDRRVRDQRLTFIVTDSTALTLTDEETGTTWDALGVATAGPLAGTRLERLADAYTMFWFAWSVFHPNTRLAL